jgi:hypothetical protein
MRENHERHAFLLFVVVLCMAAFLVMRLRDTTEEEKRRFVEYVKVQGICYEDHVQRAGRYRGDLVSYYTDGDQAREYYGSVTRVRGIIDKARMEHSNKSYPPVTIELSSVQERDIHKNVFFANGSVNSSSEYGEQGYEAACILRVVERLDQYLSEPSYGRLS